MSTGLYVPLSQTKSLIQAKGVKGPYCHILLADNSSAGLTIWKPYIYEVFL